MDSDYQTRSLNTNNHKYRPGNAQTESAIRLMLYPIPNEETHTEIKLIISVRKMITKE